MCHKILLNQCRGMTTLGPSIEWIGIVDLMNGQLKSRSFPEETSQLIEAESMN